MRLWGRFSCLEQGLEKASLWLHFFSVLALLAFSVFISLQFVLEYHHFLSSWPLAPCGFISFYWHSYCGFLHPFFLSLYFLPFYAVIPFHFAPLAPCSRFIVAFCRVISFNFGFLWLHFLSFLPSHLSFPLILAFWAFSPFIAFHFGLLGLHFLSYLPSPPSFPFIFAFSPVISLHFEILGLHCLSFWPFEWPSFPFIFAFSPFISIHFGLLKTNGFHFCSFSRFVASCAFILAFCGSICFHVGFLWLCFCPLIFAFCGFISFQFCLLTFHFGLLGFHFLSFLPSHPSFPFICPFSPFISFHFGLLTLHFLIFWPFGPSFPFIFALSPFILAFWAFISLHFCLLTVHFLSFWPFGSSFPFILTPWVFM